MPIQFGAPWWALFLLLSLCEASFLRSVRRRDLPTCSCDCCEVASRRSDEVAFGVSIKCAPSDQHAADMCPENCNVDEDDKLLPTSDGSLQYVRFCFQECKPFQGATSPKASECVGLDTQDLQLVVDENGNARDPAVAMVAEANRIAQTAAAAKSKRATAALASKAAVQRIDPAAVKVFATNMNRQADVEGAAARLQAQDSRDTEVDEATALNKRLKGEIHIKRTGIRMGMAGLNDIHNAMLNAEEEAQVAAEAAQSAISSVHEGKKQAWQTAVGEGQASVASVKAQADAKAKADAAKWALVVNNVEMKMLAAAEKAARPYHLSMLRAQQTVADYTKEAKSQASEAIKRETAAKNLESSARKAQAAGAMAKAEGLIGSAQSAMKDAKRMAAQARQMFASADEINKSIPKYAAAAQAAAARAAYDMQPAWQR